MTKIVYFEGNIGAGKTYNIDLLKKYHSDEFIFLPEPVDLWKDLGIFEKYYEDPKRWAFTFQIMSLISKITRADCVKNEKNKILIIERSGFGDKIMFFDQLYKQKDLLKMEHDIYELFYENVIQKYDIMNSKLRKFVICKAPIDILMKRIKKRNRSGEGSISEDYIKGLDFQLNNILIPELRRRKKTVHILDFSKTIDDTKTEMERTKELYKICTKF